MPPRDARESGSLRHTGPPPFSHDENFDLEEIRGKATEQVEAVVPLQVPRCFPIFEKEEETAHPASDQVFLHSEPAASPGERGSNFEKKWPRICGLYVTR